MLEAGFSCLLLLLSVARLSKKYMSFIYQYLIYISFIYNWFVVVVLLRLIDFCGLIDFFFLFWFDFWDLYFFVVLDKLLCFIAEVGMRMLLMEALLWFIGWSTSVNDVIEASLHMLLWWWWWRWCHMLLGTIHSHLGYEMHRLCLAMLLSQTHRHRLRCSLGYNVVQRRYCLLCFLAFVVPASTNGAYNECWSVCVCGEWWNWFHVMKKSRKNEGISMNWLKVNWIYVAMWRDEVSLDRLQSCIYIKTFFWSYKNIYRVKSLINWPCMLLTVQMPRPLDDLLACRARYSFAQWNRICRRLYPTDHRLSCVADWSHTDWYPWSIHRQDEHMKPKQGKEKD